jgi:subtilisin family serine protease
MRFFRRGLGLALALLFLFAGAAQAKSKWFKTPYVPGEVLVRWADNPEAKTLAAEARRLGLATAETGALHTAMVRSLGATSRAQHAAFNVERLALPAGLTPEQAVLRLKASALVKYCEPNYIRHAFTVVTNGPNDPLYQNDQLWWYEAVQADRVWAQRASLLPASKVVIVAVVDSGVNLTHPDLQANLLPGLSQVVESGYTPPAGGMDDNGHGTHVAGILGAIANNSAGIAGTGSAAVLKILPVKVLDDTGSGSDDDIAYGITWAVDQGAKVINMSLGGPQSGQILEDAVNYAHQHGCMVVAAAGNDALDDNGKVYNPAYYPAAYPSVIAVASCDKQGVRAYYSEYGSYVEVAAPGGSDGGSQSLAVVLSQTILSTALPGKDTWVNSTSTSPAYIDYQPGTAQLYGYDQGTSMASPVVAGVAAMLIAQNPARTPEDVENILATTADKTGSDAYANGWNAYEGWGRVNAYRALSLSSTFVPLSSGHASYNYPNPFQPGTGQKTYVVVPLAAGQTAKSVNLKIYDSIGHLVRNQDLTSGDIYPGALVSWDGRNDRGEAVANGVYPYRLNMDGTVYTNKIAVKN